MGINSYVTKAMFDANPDHEFYVEESYPMDWMYPYLTPFGIIMQVNRQPLELTRGDDEARPRFLEPVFRPAGGKLDYLRHDGQGTVRFCGEGLFAARLQRIQGRSGSSSGTRTRRKAFPSCARPLGRAFTSGAPTTAKIRRQRARLEKEAEFAFKQSFAYCPYSEGASKYAQLLLETGRTEEALLVLKTFQKLDPYNRQGQDMVKQLEQSQPEAAPMTVTSDSVFAEIEADMRANQTNRASELLEQLLRHPQANVTILMQGPKCMCGCATSPNRRKPCAGPPKSSRTPRSSSWGNNLASLQAIEGHAAAAAKLLEKAFAANAGERAADPQMIDLRDNARTNRNFNAIRETPEFRAVVPPR